MKLNRTHRRTAVHKKDTLLERKQSIQKYISRIEEQGEQEEKKDLLDSYDIDLWIIDAQIGLLDEAIIEGEIDY